MWTKIGMAAMLAVLLASTADLGYAQAADGRATEGGTTGNGGSEVGGRGPSGTPLGGGDRSIHTKPSNETSPGISGGGAGGSSAPATGGSTGAAGSGGSPSTPR